jgi:hypothetical protein
MTFAKALIGAALAALLATSAFAETLFVLQEDPQTMPAGAIDIKGITADVAGTVAIYAYSGGTYGELLGSVPVNAGANEDVVVDLNIEATGNVMAVLFAGDVTTPDLGVAMLEIILESRAE